MLRRNTTLKRLNIAGNQVGLHGGWALVDVLRGNTALEGLDMSSTGCGDHTVRGLAEALKHNTTLKSLDLHNNQVLMGRAQQLRNTLRDYNQSGLVDLQLGGNWDIPRELFGCQRHRSGSRCGRRGMRQERGGGGTIQVKQ